MAEAYVISFPVVDWRGISPFTPFFKDAKELKKQDVPGFVNAINKNFPGVEVPSLLDHFPISFIINCYLDTQIELTNLHCPGLIISDLSLGKRNDILFLFTLGLDELEGVIFSVLDQRIRPGINSGELKILMNELFIALVRMYPSVFEKYTKVKTEMDYFLLKENK